MKKKRKLTQKQMRFCEEYLIDLNATQAAIRAGYSLRSARQIANENMSKHDINQKIQELLQRKMNDRKITLEKVLDELAAIAFFTIREIYRINENGEFEVDLEKVLDCRNGIQLEHTKNGVKIRTYNKLRALEILANYVGLFDQKPLHGVEKSEIDLSALPTEKLRLIKSAWTS